MILEPQFVNIMIDIMGRKIRGYGRMQLQEAVNRILQSDSKKIMST